MVGDIHLRMRIAKEDHDRAVADIINVVYDALVANVPILRISKDTGIARQTIYNLKDKLEL